MLSSIFAWNLAYVVVNRKDNSIGKPIYDEWCPENGGGPRNYLGNMGKGITADIRTYMPEPTDAEPADDAQPDNESNENEHEDDNQFAAFSQQVINNSLLIQQNGDNNTILPNYVTIQMQVNQQFCGIPQLGGRFYVPPRINREYYNIFVIGTEANDKPYFKVPRDRALSECISEETKEKFSGMTKEDKQQIIMMPSLFMVMDQEQHYKRMMDEVE